MHAQQLHNVIRVRYVSLLVLILAALLFQPSEEATAATGTVEFNVADSAITVGVTFTDPENPDGYLYDLEYILIKTGAGEASGMGSSWILNQATGVALNDDLTARIVGWGVNPEGGIEAWLAAEYPYGELEPLLVKE